MEKRLLQRVISALFILFIIGIWLIPHQTARAEDDFILKIRWLGDLTNQNILCLFNFYECEYSDGSVVQLTSYPSASCEVGSNPKMNADKEHPDGQNIDFPLPRNKKFIIEVIPLMKVVYNQDGTYDVQATVYKEQYHSKKSKIEDLGVGDILDTGQGDSITNYFKLDDGREISGFIHDSNDNPIEGVKIKVWNKNRYWARSYGISGGWGKYTIYGLLPGEYYLRADGDSAGKVKKYYPNADYFDDEAELIDVTEENATGVNFELAEGKFVTGRLFDLSDPGDPDKVMRGPVQLSLVHPTYSDITLATYFHDANHSDPDFYPGKYGRTYDYMERYLYTRFGVDLAYVDFNENGTYSIGGFPSEIEGRVILKAEAYTDLVPWMLQKMPGKRDYAPLCYPDAYFFEDAEPILLSEIGTRDFDLHFIKGGKISGSVKVKDNEGQGIEDIVVMISDTSNKTPLYIPFAYTDANGAYELDGLPLLDYKALAIDMTDRQHRYQQQYYDNKFNPLWAAQIHVTEEKRTFDDIDFKLPLGGRIAGEVTDLSGKKLSNITINAFRLTSDISLSNYPNNLSGSTFIDPNDDGKYEISGLPPGRYILQAAPLFGENYINVYYEDSTNLNGACSDIVIEDPNQLKSPFNFELKKGGRIKGQIKGIPEDINNKFIVDPIENSSPFFHIDLYEAKTGGLMGKTNEQIIAVDANTWSYEIMGIPPGEYRIGISDEFEPRQLITNYYQDSNKEFNPNGVFLYKEASTFAIDPIANPNIVVIKNFYWDTEGAIIKGKIEADGQISKIRVEAYKEEETTKKLVYTGAYVEIYVDANSSEDFSLTGLSEGTYVLKARDVMNYFYSTEYYKDPNLNMNAFHPDDAERFEVTSIGGTEHGPYNFQLNQYGIIKGTITKGNNNPSPFSGAWVYLYNLENTSVFSPNRLGITDPNGRYTFSGLSEGSYKVRALESLYDPNRSLVPRFYTDDLNNYAFNIEDGDGVDVNYPNSTENIDICLWQKGSRITGEVKIDGSNPFLNNPYLNVYIYLYKLTDNNELSIVDKNFIDPNGRYRFQYLPVGNYRAMVWDYGETFYPSYWNSDSNQPLGLNITISQAGVAVNNIDFSLTEIGAESQQEYVIELSEGLNVFSLPIGAPIWSAFYGVNNLFNDWNNAAGAGIKDFLHFNTEDGKWENRYSGFFIENGKGYVAYSYKKKIIKYYGSLPKFNSRNLYQGMNIVGNINVDEGCDSYQMMMNLGNGAGNVHSVRRYDPTKGKWLSSTLLWGKSAGETFDIVPAEGYIVDIK